ncbi:MAG: phage tail fiber protein [Candidatus Thorarchaeota archaeon]|jgi:hypothetical protein
MTNISNYLEEALLNHVFRTSSFSKPGTVTVGLATASPTDTSTGAAFNEVADTFSYARVDLGAPADADWTSPSAGTQGEIDNAADITFTTASGGNWGTITSVTLLDNVTHSAGNILFYGDLTTAKVVNDGDTFKFSTGDLNISLD